MAVAADSRLLAERLFNGLPEADSYIFDGVVFIDFQVTLAAQLQ